MRAQHLTGLTAASHPAAATCGDVDRSTRQRCEDGGRGVDLWTDGGGQSPRRSPTPTLSVDMPDTHAREASLAPAVLWDPEGWRYVLGCDVDLRVKLFAEHPSSGASRGPVSHAEWLAINRLLGMRAEQSGWHLPVRIYRRATAYLVGESRH